MINYYTNTSEDTIDPEELALYNAIMSYRATLALPAIPLSKGLTITASRHALDSVENLVTYQGHTWSDAPYDAGNNATWPNMWTAPQRVNSGYTGNGYEITAGTWTDSNGDLGSGMMTAAHALAQWQGSAPHNAVMLNQGIWATPWNAIGVAIHDGIAHVWFGNDVDPTGGAVIDGHVPGATIGSDVLAGTANGDVIDLLAGDDQFAGMDGNDRIDGNAGNDLLIGGAGADQLIGGAGFDTAFYGNSAAVTVDLGANTGSGGEAAGDTFATVENVRGSLFNDIITGDALANALIGQGGNDVLEGMAAGDALLGGAGVDTASWTMSNGSVSVNIGNGTGIGAHAAGDILVGIENLTGSQFGDLLRGGGATANNPTTDNVLSGMGGGDLMLGDVGNDTLFGGAGGDIMTGGAGDDSFLFDNLSAEQDIITDFDQNGNDRLVFSGFGPGFDFTDFQLFTVNGNDVFVAATGWQGGVVLQDAAGLVDAGDFVFV